MFFLISHVVKIAWEKASVSRLETLCKKLRFPKIFGSECNEKPNSCANAL